MGLFKYDSLNNVFHPMLSGVYAPVKVFVCCLSQKSYSLKLFHFFYFVDLVLLVLALSA